MNLPKPGGRLSTPVRAINLRERLLGADLKTSPSLRCPHISCTRHLERVRSLGPMIAFSAANRAQIGS